MLDGLTLSEALTLSKIPLICLGLFYQTILSVSALSEALSISWKGLWILGVEFSCKFDI